MADAKNGANRRAKDKAMASFLKALGIKRESVVSPCCHTSFRTVESMLFHMGQCNYRPRTRRKLARAH